MSKVFYKFKAAKDFDAITFDGASISVFDLKKEIMVAKKLGKGTDFSLHLYDQTTNEEYTDDADVIPRSHSVIVRRMPAKIPGKGTAQRYISADGPASSADKANPDRIINGRYVGPMSLNNVTATGSLGLGQEQMPKAPGENETEEERIQRILEQGEGDFDKRAKEMALHAPRYHHFRPPTAPTTAGAPPNAGGDAGATPFSKEHYKAMMMDRGPPPPTYVCYRCSQKGHWIQDCPTNGQKEFDNIPRIKRTTGIPRTFLKVVDAPQDVRATGKGMMVTCDGSIVVAQANEEAWAALQGRHPRQIAMQAKKEETASLPAHLTCPLCAKLLRDAVKLPCCSNHFCDDCLRGALLEQIDEKGSARCPICDTVQTPDAIQQDHAKRRAVEAYSQKLEGKDVSDKEDEKIVSPEDDAQWPAEPVAKQTESVHSPVKIEQDGLSRLCSDDCHGENNAQRVGYNNGYRSYQGSLGEKGSPADADLPDFQPITDFSSSSRRSLDVLKRAVPAYHHLDNDRGSGDWDNRGPRSRPFTPQDQQFAPPRPYTGAPPVIQDRRPEERYRSDYRRDAPLPRHASAASSRHPSRDASREPRHHADRREEDTRRDARPSHSRHASSSSSRVDRDRPASSSSRRDRADSRERSPKRSRYDDRDDRAGRDHRRSREGDEERHRSSRHERDADEESYHSSRRHRDEDSRRSSRSHYDEESHSSRSRRDEKSTRDYRDEDGRRSSRREEGHRSGRSSREDRSPPSHTSYSRSDRSPPPSHAAYGKSSRR